MQPLHLALLELVIDPACAIAFEHEAEDPKVMQRPPRDARRPLFGVGDLLQASLQGLGLSAAIALTLLWATQSALWAADSAAVRSLALLTLVMGNGALILIGSGRPWQRRHPVAWGLMAATLALLAVLLHWPTLSSPLRLAPLPVQAWCLALACSLGCVSLVALLARRISAVRS